MASTSHINKPESGAWWSTLSSAAARDDPDADSELDTEDLEWEERERELMRKEFEESMQQLKVLLELIILPYAGKYFGRKLAFWAWAKYVDFGIWGLARSLVPWRSTPIRT